MKKMLIATGNIGKADFFRKALAKTGIELLDLNDVGIKADAIENYSSYKKNSLAKTKYYFEKIQGKFPVFAEDSGIEVLALRGELGVFTRRFGAGASATDKEWLDYFLKTMSEVEVEKRQARFLSFGCWFDGKRPKFFKGEVWGTILFEPQVELEPGLPISSVFVPKGFDRVLSQFSLEEKTEVSHRGKMVKKFLNFLQSFEM